MTTSPAGATRALSRDDILPLADYAKVRRDQRRMIAEVKQQRRVEVGPIATFSFENFATMQQQVQEVLHIAKGGAAQLDEELAAYNPLIPQGSELIATVMFEIDDPVRRATTLARLGGTENHIFLDVAGERISGEPDPTRENTSADGKASSVQFIRFRFSPAQVARFRAPGARVLAGIDHPNYGHLAVIAERIRAALAEDFE